VPAGAADLITMRGAQRLAQADVVLFDALTDPRCATWRRRRAGSTSANAAAATPPTRQPSTRCWCAMPASSASWCG